MQYITNVKTQVTNGLTDELLKLAKRRPNDFVITDHDPRKTPKPEPENQREPALKLAPEPATKKVDTVNEKPDTSITEEPEKREPSTKNDGDSGKSLDPYAGMEGVINGLESKDELIGLIIDEFGESLDKRKGLDKLKVDAIAVLEAARKG